MEENKNTARLFHVEIAQGIYLISDPEQGPTEDGKSLAPGNATANSYLIIGEERAVLLDLAVNSPELKTYAEKLAGKPVQLVLSHGHYDHAFYLNQYQDVWMNTKDKFLLKKGMLGFPPVEPCPIIHGLEAGDVIDLGGRELEVFTSRDIRREVFCFLTENAECCFREIPVHEDFFTDCMNR